MKIQTDNINKKAMMFLAGITLVLILFWYKGESQNSSYGSFGSFPLSFEQKRLDPPPPPPPPPLLAERQFPTFEIPMEENTEDGFFEDEVDSLELHSGGDRIAEYIEENIQPNVLTNSFIIAIVVYSLLAFLMVVSFLVSLFHPNKEKSETANKFCGSLITFFAGAATQMLG